MRPTEKDFEGAPVTDEPNGTFQVVELNGKNWYRNIDTGEIEK